jgi:hypothetical protein
MAMLASCESYPAGNELAQRGLSLTAMAHLLYSSVETITLHGADFDLLRFVMWVLHDICYHYH